MAGHAVNVSFHCYWPLPHFLRQINILELSNTSMPPYTVPSAPPPYTPHPDKITAMFRAKATTTTSRVCEILDYVVNVLGSARLGFILCSVLHYIMWHCCKCVLVNNLVLHILWTTSVLCTGFRFFICCFICHRSHSVDLRLVQPQPMAVTPPL